jgi:hypothetical protein
MQKQVAVKTGWKRISEEINEDSKLTNGGKRIFYGSIENKVLLTKQDDVALQPRNY